MFQLENDESPCTYCGGAGGLKSVRRDGSVRDTVMYLATEWPDVQRHLTSRLRRRAAKTD